MRAAAVVSLLVLSVLSTCVERSVAQFNLGNLLGNADGSVVCDVLQMDGFYGTQTHVPTFETCNWQQAPASLRFCTDNYGYQHQDQCKWQCSTNHTITLSVFSRYHTFNVIVNGYVLTATGWVALPYNFRTVNSTIYGGWPSNSSAFNSLHGIQPLNVDQYSPYFTGQYNMPTSSAPNQYTCPNSWVLLADILEVALGYAPIYRIPFPYWNCNPSSLLDGPSSTNTIKNFVSVNVAWNLDGFPVCAQPNGQDFVFTRNCSSGVGNNTLPSTPNGPSHALGDPQFAGLRGQEYQVHGVDGGIYNLISDPYMQLNSKFVFLTGPRPCPMIPTTGRKSVACFHHPGSYLGNLALLTNAHDRLLIESGPAERGLYTVEVNGERLIMGDNVTLSFSNGRVGYIHYVSTHEVALTIGLFEIEIENSDSFLNLRSALVRAGNWQELVDEKAHGLLGQTWQVRKGKSAIEGKVDDYMLMSEDLYGSDFMYNRFGVTDEEEEAAVDAEE